MLSESLKKRAAAALVGRHGRVFEALGGNARLRQWLSENKPFPSFPDRYQLYHQIQAQVLGAEPIDYLEFGVSRGDSILKWADINSHPDSRFVGFDTFDGLPEPWVSISAVAAKGAYSAGGVQPETNDHRIRFVKGLFSATLRTFLEEFQPRSRLVVHNDSDLFSSTLYMLATVDPILVPGSILIFDEFANPTHEWRAFSDYMAAFGRSFKLLGASGNYYTQVALELTA
jgi:O-methyltransferase